MSKNVRTIVALWTVALSACSSSSNSSDAGTPGTGGTTGGTAGTTGGTAGTTGGTAGTAGGTAGATGTTDGGGAVDTTMNFFVTSRGPGNGGNLGGLAGADAFCKTLAMAVSTALGAKTWHAYLSTTTVNARDRIGTGPWRNAAGHVIANNLTDLLAQGATLATTWPLNDPTVALDETGAQVPTATHDILTGSTTDGMLSPGGSCTDWTSSSTTGTAQIGHCNRNGNNLTSWNSAHTVGCAEPTANRQAMTVSSGGGRGSVYCFAIP